MISCSGYGLFLVIFVYVGAGFFVSRLFGEAGELVQVIAIACTVLVSTVINYFLARRLNRDGVKHTVYGMRLETVVLCLGGVLLFLALMMLSAEFKSY